MGPISLSTLLYYICLLYSFIMQGWLDVFLDYGSFGEDSL